MVANDVITRNDGTFTADAFATYVEMSVKSRHLAKTLLDALSAIEAYGLWSREDIERARELALSVDTNNE